MNDIKVNIEISHTFISDLPVDSVTPWGQSLTLHNRTGNSRNDFRKTYDKLTVPALEALKNEQIKGNWSLRGSDPAKFDWHFQEICNGWSRLESLFLDEGFGTLESLCLSGSTTGVISRIDKGAYL